MYNNYINNNEFDLIIIAMKGNRNYGHLSKSVIKGVKGDGADKDIIVCDCFESIKSTSTSVKIVVGSDFKLQQTLNSDEMSNNHNIKSNCSEANMHQLNSKQVERNEEKHVHVDYSFLTETLPLFVQNAISSLQTQDFIAMVNSLDFETHNLQDSNQPELTSAVVFGYGIAYYKMQKYSLAIPMFERLEQLAIKGLTLRANASLAFIYLGDIYSVESNFSEGAKCYNQAIQFYGISSLAHMFKVQMPSKSSLYLKLGTALKKSDQIMQAVDSFKNAVASAKYIQTQSVGNHMDTTKGSPTQMVEFCDGKNIDTPQTRNSQNRKVGCDRVKETEANHYCPCQRASDIGNTKKNRGNRVECDHGECIDETSGSETQKVHYDGYKGHVTKASGCKDQRGSGGKDMEGSTKSGGRSNKGMVCDDNKIMVACTTVPLDTSGIQDELSAHTSLGNIYQSLAEYQCAVQEYECALRLAESMENNIALAWNHGNIGNAYLGLFHKEKAIYHLELSLQLTELHECTPVAMGRANNNLGTAYQSMNELDKAEKHYNLARDHSIHGQDTQGEARALGNIGNLYMLRKDFDKAYKHYSETLDLILSIGHNDPTVFNAYHNRGCCQYEMAMILLREFGSFITIPHKDECTPPADQISKSEAMRRRFECALDDLLHVIDQHEMTLHTMKGSAVALNLSVSLFESSSRTFHRVQDCLVALKRNNDALVYAEQSRSRSLGEFLLKRQHDKRHKTPLNYEGICTIVASQNCPVVYLSYTGDHVLLWVLATVKGVVTMEMTEVCINGKLFDEKTLDSYLRYTLPEIVSDNDLDMFGSCDYNHTRPLQKLDDIITTPLLKMLSSIQPRSISGAREVILIPDSYTVMPMVAFFDTVTGSFLGDKLMFRIMPSILTMGVMNHSESTTGGPTSVEVNIPSDFCIVGDPEIPTFRHKGEDWTLGKLPHAEMEAQWVAHIVHANAILHSNATKPMVISMLERTSCKVIHIATHGSSVSGFLAFSGHSIGSLSETVEGNTVLLFPHEVESLTINASLVVLSSCDSSRGVVRADGVLGMARAFILAGAKSVLTTLWRVPDESAGVFMQFFYQYLMDGMRSTIALHKSILSVRCFKKYAKHVHWSAYQLTGQDIQLKIMKETKANVFRSVFGTNEVAAFPRLDILMKLESAFLVDPLHQMSYIQVNYFVKMITVLTYFVVTSYYKHLQTCYPLSQCLTLC